MVVGLPWLIFSLILCLFAFAMEDYSVLIFVMVAACVLVALLFITMSFVSGIPSHLAVGLLILFSVGVSVPIGLVIVNLYMSDYWKLVDGATYWNLDPVEPSASHVDAAQLHFVEGSFVDTQRSAGYMRDGTVYCAAPITGPHASNKIEYWAVGKDCCERRGDFWCGNAQAVTSSPGGLVSTEGAEQYRLAAKMAKSEHRLATPQGAGAPLFVEWSTHAEQRLEALWQTSRNVVLTASGLHLVLSGGAGFLMARSLSK